MTYTVVIEQSDEGFAVSVAGLPGCHSQGDTEAEALANIADAIREYLDVVRESSRFASYFELRHRRRSGGDLNAGVPLGAAGAELDRRGA